MFRPSFLLIAPLVLTACSGGDDTPEVGPQVLHRLSLEAAVEIEIPAVPELVHEIKGEALQGLRIPAEAQTQLLKNALVLKDAKRFTILNVPDSFDTIQLEVVSKEGGKFRPRILSKKNETLVEFYTSTEFMLSKRKPRPVTVDMPEALQHEGKMGSVTMNVVGSAAQAMTLHSIKFYKRPLENWLPHPGKADFIRVGPDMRLGTGVSDRRPVTTAISAEEAKGTITFSVAVPPYLRGITEHATVTAVLKSGDRTFEDDYSVNLEGWKECDLKIPVEAEGQACELTLSVRQSSEKPVLIAASAPIIETSDKEPKTVLLVTSDTHRGDALSLVGGESETPFLDNIAARGYYFEDCFAAGNNTNPAHLSIFTGVPVRDHTIIGNDMDVGMDAHTLGRIFAEEGYHTFAALSTAHLAWSGCHAGFDRMCAPIGLEQDSQVTLKILRRWLDESDHRSVFIWLHSFDPHGPYKPPANYAEMYKPDKSSPMPESEIPSWARKIGIDDPRDVEARYMGEVTYWDHQLDQLFGQYPRLGEGVVALIGDHGENMYHPERPFSHHLISRDTLHVPLMLTFPGADTAMRVEWPVDQHDLGRTLLDVSGLNHRPFPGNNILPVGKKYTGDPNDVMRYAIEANAMTASVTRGKWMLIHGLYAAERQAGKRVTGHTVGLFDITKDPACLINLADENRELALELRSALVDYLCSYEVLSGIGGVQKTDALQHLAALGYSESTALPDENPWIDPKCDCESCLAWPLQAQ